MTRRKKSKKYENFIPTNQFLMLFFPLFNYLLHARIRMRKVGSSKFQSNRRDELLEIYSFEQTFTILFSVYNLNLIVNTKTSGPCGVKARV